MEWRKCARYWAWVEKERAYWWGRKLPNYFDLVRDVVGDLAEEMALIDEYENAAKFGEGKKSYAYRITYRSIDRTLTGEEIEASHAAVAAATAEQFGGVVR